MKKVIFTAFLSYFLIVTSQVQARTFYTTEHVRIIENLNGDKSNLFKNSKKWVANNFNSAQDALVRPGRGPRPKRLAGVGGHGPQQRH
ncbi:hypothetical protein OXU89_07250 [Acinetobacter baumannii]|uniref:hypothetical protein n=1 Tax=Acinetobacter baumannii TaxID=470 RepID=UPI00227A2DF5|nr:hypothetical protein [Acinetobacter baumannii]MCY6387304.1 hypothetical protein [Acinetobacter baumannii]